MHVSKNDNSHSERLSSLSISITVVDIESSKFGRHDRNDWKDFYDWRFVEKHSTLRINSTELIVIGKQTLHYSLRLQTPRSSESKLLFFSINLNSRFPTMMSQNPTLTRLLDFSWSVSMNSFDSEFIDLCWDYRVHHWVFKDFYQIKIVRWTK